MPEVEGIGLLLEQSSNEMLRLLAQGALQFTPSSLRFCLFLFSETAILGTYVVYQVRGPVSDIPYNTGESTPPP